VKDLLDFISHPKVSVLFAGVAGTAVYLLHEGRDLAWPWRLATLIAGALIAHFLTHPVIRIFSLHNVDDGPGTGFVLGMFGMSLVGAGIRVSKQIDWAAVSQFLPWGRR
jgi:hypothetical protein